MNNKGFSLIELIITITIIVILSGSAFYGLNYMNYAKVSECMNEIDLSLSQLRMETMSKGRNHYFLVIEQDDGNSDYYISIRESAEELDDERLSESTIIGTRKKIASNKLKISYYEQEDPRENFITPTSPLIISYVSHSGAFHSPWTKLKVSGSNKVMELVMVTKTGIHYVQ